MNNYNFEFVEYDDGYPAKIFLASLEQSDFHWHNEYEFLFVLKGEVKVTTVSGIVILHAGELMLINGKMVHEVRKMEEDNIVLFVQMSSEFFEIEKESHDYKVFHLNSAEKNLLPECGMEPFAKLLAKIGFLAETQKRDKKIKFRIRALLYELAAECMEHIVYEVKKNGIELRDEARSRCVVDLLRYIQEHYYEEYVCENICEEFSMSKGNIHKRLKEQLGLSLKELVTEYRIDEAKRLLKYTEKTISAVADIVGFNSDKTFYRVFKAQTGVSPKEYRMAGYETNKNNEIRGYMEFGWRETMGLLKKYCGD